MEKITRQQAFCLSIDAYYKKSSHSEYTAEQRAEGLRVYLEDLNKDFRENKNKIFQIIEDTVQEVLPKRVLELVRNYAEFKEFGDNTELKFNLSNGKIKAVEVALGGRVERQRIDKGSFSIKSTALQVKVYEEFERVIGGMVDWTSLINMVIDAIMEAILVKIYECLTSLMSKLPSANKHTAPSMEQAEFDRVLSTVRAYGTPVIVGTARAISMLPLTEYASDEDKADIRNKGYLGKYKGSSVVELVQSFEDSDNAKKVFDESYILIIPSGSEKIVKVGLHGGIKVDDSRGADWTYNFEAYQKVAVGVLAVNHLGMYKMTDLETK